MQVALIDPSLFTLPYDAALASGLREIGHEVHLYGRLPRPEDAGPAQVPVHDCFYRVGGHPAVRALPNTLRLGIKGMDHFVSMARLGARLRRERPDVIHFQWLPLPLLDRWFLAGLRAIAPLVLTVHDSDPFNGNPASRVQRRGARAALLRFDRLIVHTAQGRARLLEQGVPPERIALLPHGLLAHPARAAASEESTDGRMTFVLFGKIKPYKGADVLIEAFARLLPALRARACVRIVGQPYMDLAPLHALAQRLGVADRVSIEPRFVPDHEIATLFGPGSIAVFPYREIEASGVLSLAIARARPVLASRLGGFAETIRQERDGLLVPPGEPAALADAMARFLAEPGFVASCARSVAGLADAMPDWAGIARLTVAVYVAAAGRGRPARGYAIRPEVPPRPAADGRS
jgi:glycosyltransferase involved in cell wall biosynthesis